MPPVPVLTPREVLKAFKKLGWEVARQRGSHPLGTSSETQHHFDQEWGYGDIVSAEPSRGRTRRPYDERISRSIEVIEKAYEVARSLGGEGEQNG